MILKYLLLVAVLVLAFLWWQHGRRTQARKRAQQAQAQRPTRHPPATPDAMVTCHHCGLHLPAADAVKGSLGYYCGQKHRRLAEG